MIHTHKLVPLLMLLALGLAPARAQYGLSEGAPGASPPPEATAAAPAPADLQLVFDVDGGIESVVGDGRFILHGKLRMRQDGEGALVSEEAIDQFWRYTSVNPPNVWGDNTEQRFASVLLLSDRSRVSRERHVRAMRRLGERTHERYYADRTLHTNEHFYLAGDPAGRFRVSRGEDGGLDGIENDITDGVRQGRWYPYAFRGLAKALALLEDTPYSYGSLERTLAGRNPYVRRLGDFEARFEALLTRLEPAAKKLWYEVPDPTMRFTRRVADGVLHLRGVTSKAPWKGGWGILRKSGTLTMVRTVEVEVDTGRIRKDTLSFEVEAGSMLECSMTVGFLPMGGADRAD